MQEQIAITYRPSLSPRAAVPLGARSVGTHKVSKGWAKKGAKIKDIIQVFWCVAGEGVVTLKNERHRIRPDEVAIYMPGNKFHIAAPDMNWECRWWTMDGPRALDVLNDFGLTGPWPRKAGPCPNTMLDSLRAQIREVSLASEFAASVTAYQLLSLLATRLTDIPEKSHAFIDHAIELVSEKYADEEFCINALARELGIHRSRLSREFKRRTGLSPKKYLTTLRLQKGMSLLQETNLQVSQIAYMVGFADPAYFSRCITDIVGSNPTRFRHS
jgi:AraC-like DNA-binding protein